MKKLLTLLLAGSMLLTLTACNRDKDDGVSGEEPRLPFSDEIKQTRTYNALQIIAGNDYSLDVQIDGAPFMRMYRRGDDFHLVAMTVRHATIAGGQFYEFDPGRDVVYQRPATAEDIAEMQHNFEDFEEIFSLRGDATLTGTGREDFMDLGDMDYEEFLLPDGTNRRAYFNDKGELFGIYHYFAGVITHFVWHIIEGAPAHVFEIPSNFQVRPWSERPNA
jgi:hypothetical protein